MANDCGGKKFKISPMIAIKPSKADNKTKATTKNTKKRGVHK